MRTKILVVVFIGVSLLGEMSSLAEEAKNPKEIKVKYQTECPVMGGEINKKLFVDVKGKRIYVCCKGCIEAIKKDPDKYIEKLEKAGITIEKVKSEKETSTGAKKKSCH